MADGIPVINEFLSELRNQGAEPELSGESWQRAGAVCLVAGLGHVMIVATDANPGQWSLAGADVQRLQQLAADDGVPCWFVLLISRRDGRGANGYVLKDLVSSPLKRPLELDGETYDVREKRHLDSLRLLLSTEKIADVLLRQRHG